MSSEMGQNRGILIHKKILKIIIFFIKYLNLERKKTSKVWGCYQSCIYLISNVENYYYNLK